MTIKKRIQKIVSATCASALLLGAFTFVAPHTSAARTNPTAAVNQSEEDKGVLVARVQKDSPAAKAGVRRGDIVLSVDGKTVNTNDELLTAVNALTPNANIKIIVLRGDAEQTLTLTVGDNGGKPFLGISLAREGDTNERGRKFPEMDMGAVSQPVVTDVQKDSPAAKAGVKKGDAILAIDGVTVTLQTNLAQLVAAKKISDTLTLKLKASDSETAPEREVSVVLGENPNKKGTAWLGIQYAPKFKVWRMPQGNDFATTQGAVVSQVLPDSPAAKAGITPLDAIVALNGNAIDSPQALADGIRALKIGDGVTLKIMRGNATQELKATLAENPNDKGKPYLGVSLISLRAPLPPGNKTG